MWYPTSLKGDTVLYKKLIAGVLVALQQRAFAYLQLLDSGKYTHEQILEVLQFLQKQLYCKNPETKNLEDAELVIYLKEKPEPSDACLRYGEERRRTGRRSVPGIQQ